MIGVLLGIAFGQELTFGKFHSRAEFQKAAATIKDDFTQAQVERILGKPDDIWPSTDSKRYINMEGGEIWGYGTNGHHTLPTLGSITFRHGKVLIGTGHGDPPSTSVISEAELRAAMRKLHRFDYLEQLNDGVHYDSNDPLRLIQAVNDLQPLGTEKALAAIVEYANIVPLWCDDRDFLFWLTHVLFVGKKPGYVFPIPGLGAPCLKPPPDKNKWPTFPVRIVRGFPVNMYQGSTLGGFPEPIQWYVRDHGKDWMIRPDKIAPPDDPFPIYKELLTSGIHPFDGTNDRMHLASEIIRAVRNAVRVSSEEWRDGPDVSDAGIESVHQKFLKAGGHWDAKLGLYVRKDGSFDPDHVRDYQSYTYKYPDMGNISVTMTLSRDNEEEISFDITTEEKAVKGVRTAVMIARNAETKAELYWGAINSRSQTLPWETTWQKMLKEAPHTGQPGGMGCLSGFDLKLGTPIIIEIRYGDKVYTSPVYRP